jgi:conjugal transfer pilus assembly protein TraB
MNKSATHPVAIKKKQLRTLFIGLAIVSMLFLGVYSLLENHSPPPSPTKEKEETVHFETPLTHVDTQAVWMERAQNQLAQGIKATEVLNHQLQLLQQSKETQDKTAQEQAQTLQTLQEQVAALQKKLAHRQSIGPSNGDETDSSIMNSENNEVGSISDHAISLASSRPIHSLKPAKNPLTFVPAGTFVRAIALGGADASAGITSQGNPTPMLFRLLERGTLPNHHQGQLKNCIATAAAIGDVSSERGEIRLERLSCIRASGAIVEMPVEATVFGPDGKNGVRGNPLWREGALLRRAFAAGSLSGLSSGIAHGFTSSSLNALGNAQTVVDSSKILQYGVANGLSNAAEKLADYNVKRAEQYHPVIQLSAGTIVDIVFLKGFYLDGRKFSDNEQDALAPVTSHFENEAIKPATSEELRNTSKGEEFAPLPLTSQQIERLKQKDNQLGFL